jgi:hypothetical protein
MFEESIGSSNEIVSISQLNVSTPEFVEAARKRYQFHNFTV